MRVNKFYVIFLLVTLFACSKGENNKQDPLEQSKSSSFKAENLKIDENGLSLLNAEIRTAHGNVIF